MMRLSIKILDLLGIGILSAGGLLAAGMFAGEYQRIDIAKVQAFVSVELAGGSTLNVAATEVTWGQWQACVKESACPDIKRPTNAKQDYPVIGVSWFDTQAYVKWLARKTGEQVRLPRLGEWQIFAADHAPKPRKKLFTDPRMAWAADYDITAKPRSNKTKQVHSFGQNIAGLSDLKGNVWEWTATDCATLENENQSDITCYGGGRIAMGEHVAILSDFVRDPGNASCGGGIPPSNLGFRIVFQS